jgi:exonuclease VII large subunit
VAGQALRALNYVDPKTAYKLAKDELAGANEELKSAVLNTIAKKGAIADQELMLKEFEKAKRYATISMTNNLLVFLEHQNSEIYVPNLEKIRHKIEAIETWYIKYYALNTLKKYGDKNLKNNPFYKEVFGVYSSLLSLEKDERIVRYLLSK